MPTATPLLNAADNVSGSLVVNHGTTALTNPHVVEVQLINKGRRGISSSQFDAGQPIRLDVGAPIVELLQVTSEPSSLHLPTTAIDGCALKVGPSLIAKGQTLTFALLVDGPNPQFTCQAALVDVALMNKRDPARQQTTAALGLSAAGVATTVLVVVFAGLSQFLMFTKQGEPMGKPMLVAFIVLTSLWAGACGWTAATSWSRRRRT
ncbi:hypothetical protein [Streptomyces yangpuensis]|uniref:hypothetical protein n=1 Tax=Streptomyces yangpuensis TaxID=1648182 RepID=UPI003719CB6C